MTDSAKLVPVQMDPFNAETPIEALSEPITPTPLVYVRNHFDVPKIDIEAWRLVVDGMVERPLRITLSDLQDLPHRQIVVTLECAGNGRALMAPIPSGTPWRLGAVSTIRVTGTPLYHVLERARIKSEAIEVLFVGADRGAVKERQIEPFARSLSLDVAGNPDVLLVWALNDEALTLEHGYPVRLIVPNWYGMASVKWLVRISALPRPFEGYFQKENYVYEGESDRPGSRPVTLMRTRSLISSPADGSEHPLGTMRLLGMAWSGHGSISHVEISTDQGSSWSAAELGKPLSSHSATPWQFEWNPSTEGSFEIMVRATDDASNTQPLEPVWNVRGFGNNAVERIRVTLR